MESLDRRVSVILAADVVGYTSLMQHDEQASLSKINHFENVIKAKSKSYQGEIIKSFGDGCIILFNSAVNAASCAIEIQRQLRKEPQVPLRIGIHIGELVHKNQDVFGDGVNIASRIEGMGVANSILLSAVVREQLYNHPKFQIKKIGRFKFKNVAEPVNLFSLSGDGLTVPGITEMKGKGELAPSGFLRNKKFMAVVAVALILVVFGINLFDSEKASSTMDQPEVIKMAVLPLINLNQDTNLEYFSDGVTVELIDELAKVSEFQVSPFTSTRVYKHTQKSLIDIASELSVSLILSGSSRIDEDSVRLSLELINPVSNVMVWSNQYDDMLSNSIRIQSDIAEKVASALNIELSPEEELKIQGMSTDNFEAFDLFLRAKAEFSSMVPSGLFNSKKLLERAIQLDPKYAQAYLYLAWVHFNLAFGGRYDLPESPFTESHPKKIRSLIETAIALDSTNSDNYVLMAAVNMYHYNNLNEAIRNVNLALDINSWPKIPIHHCICIPVNVSIATGELQRALEINRLARKIDPSNILLLNDEGIAQLLLGNQDTALDLFNQSLEMIGDKEFIGIYLYRWAGWANYHTGNYITAYEHFSKTIDNPTLNHMATAYMSNVYYKMGKQDSSDIYLDQLVLAHSAGERHLNIPLAITAMGRGEHREAMEHLTNAYNERDFGFAYYLNMDPIFDEIRETDEFIDLLNLPPFQSLVDL
jgi:TolB-like protein/class 3 adenylate cyclase/Tfp pilus assembly protein PilF